MLFNTSHTNKEYERESNETLGKAFSFFEKLKIDGAGSSRFMVEELSAKLEPENMETLYMHYANIELRPKGIIIHFANRLDRYSWIVPYYRLIVFSTETFSIHSNGNFIQFMKNKNYKNNKKFIRKMTGLKNAFLDLEYYAV